MKIAPIPPDLPLLDYLLVIEADVDLQQKIKTERELFAQQFNAAPVIGPANLPLVAFSQYRVAEERIVRHLQSIAGATPAIMIGLDGFDGLPSHTIYLRVKCGRALQTLQKNIQTSTQRFMKVDDRHKPNFINEPQIAVARKLKPWQYEKAFPEYSVKNFIGKFSATGMMLLRKNFAESKFNVAARFLFSPELQTTLQRNLFE